jgi:hypothetical protein
VAAKAHIVFTRSQYLSCVQKFRFARLLFRKQTFRSRPKCGHEYGDRCCGGFEANVTTFWTTTIGWKADSPL